MDSYVYEDHPGDDPNGSDQLERCPACGAGPGEACLRVERRNGSRKPRKRCHAERWNAAAKLRDVTRREEVERDLEAIARFRSP